MVHSHARQIEFSKIAQCMQCSCSSNTGNSSSLPTMKWHSHEHPSSQESVKNQSRAFALCKGIVVCMWKILWTHSVNMCTCHTTNKLD